MIYTTYFLNFVTPIHIGDHKPDSYENTESFLRSDTINAAIIASWAKLGHIDWIETCKGALPFTISSAFPYYGVAGSENIFFPRLKIPFDLVEKDARLSKQIKKITWMDKNYFETVINSKKIEKDFEAHIKKEFLTSDKNFPKDGFMTKQISERVAIPRERTEDNQSEPFYMERIYFENGGLYFLAIGDEFEKLEAALNVLKYEGFGTDRNIGNGFFEWHRSNISIDLPKDVKYSTNLGMYCPESKEKVETEIDDYSGYNLVKRGGWITSSSHQSIEKDSIYMFGEGSIFKKSEAIDGQKNIDLSPKNLPTSMKPGHPIYRSGCSIFIPVKITSP
ncbi:MAG TPA: type III-A CRISPR-associated RAMP protein Csm4 [Saprospiraceae bacterium]|nr:type III-A CRISPR-associated RAMP protein Csm4 [Saprospiraceae bacterium]